MAEMGLVDIHHSALETKATNKGYEVIEDPSLLPIDMVGPNREVFMTGTGAGVMPITHVHGVAVGDGKPGPVTRRLVDVYRKRMADPAYGLSIGASRDETIAYLKG